MLVTSKRTKHNILTSNTIEYLKFPSNCEELGLYIRLSSYCNRNILVMWLECRFMDTEVDSSNPDISMLHP